jgi:Bacterial PH domain/Short C-terminal domain
MTTPSAMPGAAGPYPQTPYVQPPGPAAPLYPQTPAAGPYPQTAYVQPQKPPKKRRMVRGGAAAASKDKLVRRAQPHLESGEPVVAAVMGTYETKFVGNDTIRSGVLLATDRRIVFYAKRLGGYELESFPYKSVSSIEQSKSLMGHAVSFIASGNRVNLKWIPEGRDLAAFLEVVKSQLSGRPSTHSPGAVPAVASAQPARSSTFDIPDQIRKLGGLRDAGVLTEAEFLDKKADLLRRL